MGRGVYMSRNPYGSDLYKQATLLSQKVSELDPFFKEIALMDIDNRVKYAFLFAIMENNILDLNLLDLNIEEIIDKVLKPIIQRVGQAKFRADPLTHLGFKVGKTSTTLDYDKENE